MSSANLASSRGKALTFSLPPEIRNALEDVQALWDRERKTDRLWNKDASLWTDKDESHWLDWMDIVDQQLSDVARFKALAAEIQEDGFNHILLLGMGGSSLCPEVFGMTWGKQSGFQELLVLDSTDPVQIASVRKRIDPARTLFCVSSKSGTTLEPNIYMRYFFEEATKVVGDRVGHHFIAITDPGSKLEDFANRLQFRRVYHGSPRIGGRYSALSDFGLVPHATAGLDTEKLLKRASQMENACRSEQSADNPGVLLGLLLGTAAKQFGRDKITLICSKSISGLGAWLEQLLAESTGKGGRGLIPVDLEPLVEPQGNSYGKDRVFVYIRFAGDEDTLGPKVDALAESGQPAVRIVINDLYDLGQLFFEWEIATAVAGSVIGINAFDQPDVEASKVVTRELTSEFETAGSLPPEQPILIGEGLKFFTDEVNAKQLGTDGRTVGALIRQHLDRIHPNDYFGLLAYIPMFPQYHDKLQAMRRAVLESKQVATVLGFGPRFLHSTGQAYKGGPNSGVFLQITCDESEDLPVPGQKYTFGLVKAAQARGDFQVLAARKRRVLRVHLGNDVTGGLDHLCDLICAAVAH